MLLVKTRFGVGLLSKSSLIGTVSFPTAELPVLAEGAPMPHATWHDGASATSVRIGVPPTNAWQLRPLQCEPSMRHTSRDCSAISRVGATMST